MRTFLTLLDREVKSFFYSPIAYVVLFYLLLLTGFNFYSVVSLLNHGPADVTLVEAYFGLVIFWFPFLLTFPVITMRIFSEEFQMGTFETLTTAPVRDWQVVLSKFCGALVFYVLLWLPSLLYFFIFEWVTRAEAASAAGAYWGTYLLLLLIGMFYLAIGCLASALTKNQINAAVIAFSTITLIFFAGLLTYIVSGLPQAVQDAVNYISAVEHMKEFSRGIIDSRPIAFYLSMTALTLVVTYHVFQYRKWKV